MAYRKSDETRGRILDAARRAFVDKGYYETSMGDVAAGAGIGRASLYYYFPDKERIARALYDSVVERLYAAAEAAVPPSPDETGESLLLRSFVEYLLLFRDIALNKATQAVFFDLVHFADYDEANMERLKGTIFRDTRKIAAAYGVRLSDAGHVAYIVTSDAFAKSMFKAILSGRLRFTLEEAMDYFCRHVILPDMPLPEDEYARMLRKALRICEGIAPE